MNPKAHLLMMLCFFPVALLISNCQQPVEYESRVDTLFVVNTDTVHIIEKDTVLNIDTIVNLDSVFIFDTVFTVDTIFSKDSSFIFDTNYIYDTMVIRDSSFVFDTNYTFDTVTIKDSLYFFDTTTVYDTTIFKDSIFSYDTLIMKDTIHSYDTIVNNLTVVNYDTVYVDNNCRIHVFIGQFSVTGDSVAWSDNRWIIELPITIGDDWICLSYSCDSPLWSSHTSIEKFLSLYYSGGGYVLYGFDGDIFIWDSDLELYDEYWKIVFIEPM